MTKGNSSNRREMKESWSITERKTQRGRSATVVPSSQSPCEGQNKVITQRPEQGAGKRPRADGGFPRFTCCLQAVLIPMYVMAEKTERKTYKQVL
jgi:hypothetical protein